MLTLIVNVTLIDNIPTSTYECVYVNISEWRTITYNLDKLLKLYIVNIS